MMDDMNSCCWSKQYCFISLDTRRGNNKDYFSPLQREAKWLMWCWSMDFSEWYKTLDNDIIWQVVSVMTPVSQSNERVDMITKSKKIFGPQSYSCSLTPWSIHTIWCLLRLTFAGQQLGSEIILHHQKLSSSCRVTFYLRHLGHRTRGREK